MFKNEHVLNKDNIGRLFYQKVKVRTTKKKKNINTMVSHLDIEEACKKAQILTECVVQQLETPEDITDLLKTYTKAVAEKPGKKID
jgi:hypothetical protein